MRPGLSSARHTNTVNIPRVYKRSHGSPVSCEDFPIKPKARHLLLQTRVWLCNLSCPGTYQEVQADLELSIPLLHFPQRHVSCSQRGFQTTHFPQTLLLGSHSFAINSCLLCSFNKCLLSIYCDPDAKLGVRKAPDFSVLPRFSQISRRRCTK